MVRRLLLVPFLLLFLVPVSALGGAAKLAWNQCEGDGGVAHKVFDCSTNEGTEAIVGSFVLDQDLAGVVLVRAYLGMVMFTPQTIPDWWQTNPGGCRPGSFSAFYDPSRIPGTACANPWPPISMPSWSSVVTTFSPGNGYPIQRWPGAYDMGSVRIDTGCNPAMDLQHGVEYLAFSLQLSHAKSTGDGACAGCGETVLLGTSVIDVLQVDGTVLEECYPMCCDGIDETSSVWWQSGPVASRPPTWGAIKSLYR